MTDWLIVAATLIGSSLLLVGVLQVIFAIVDRNTDDFNHPLYQQARHRVTMFGIASGLSLSIIGIATLALLRIAS